MLMEPCAQFGPVEFRVLSFGNCRTVVWACNTALSRAALSSLLLSMSFPQMLLRATMSSRDDSKDSVHARDCYFMFDNGLHHNEATMLRCFQNELGEHIDKKVFLVYVGHDEDSVKKRKQLVRDTGVFEGVEYLNLITNDAFPTIPLLQRAVFKGSNRNNFLGDLTTPAISNLWHLTAQENMSVMASSASRRMAKVRMTPPGALRLAAVALRSGRPTRWSQHFGIAAIRRYTMRCV